MYEKWGNTGAINCSWRERVFDSTNESTIIIIIISSESFSKWAKVEQLNWKCFPSKIKGKLNLNENTMLIKLNFSVPHEKRNKETKLNWNGK